MSKNTEPIEERILTVDYNEEMESSFIDYAMNVILQRALPDVRDGLKPVHRRILYAMKELGLDPSKTFRKSARIVGDVLGKYHPHGDSSVYEAMVRMSQDFNMLYPLVQGHGNFGSIDGDGAAAMRYTEAKLGYPTNEILDDLEKNIVDFQDNFDATEKEPIVLPSRFPNLLVNGSSGIAVGMTTSFPSHNLNESVKAIIECIDNPDVTIQKLMKHIKGPDFPTGGIITNQKDLLSIYESGNGKVKVRAKIEVEDAGKGKTNLVITEIPVTFAGSKGNLISKLTTLATNKKLEELTAIRDESSKDGIRIVLEVKKGVDIDKLLNKLYKRTPLQDTLGVNLLALVDGSPVVLNLKEVIMHYIEFQKELTTKKYKYLLDKANFRKEVLSGLIKAHNEIDLIIEVIRNSKDGKMVRKCLMFGDTEGINFKTKKTEKEASKLNYTEAQTEAILGIRLERLIGLELDKLNEEYDNKMKEINLYQEILSNESELLNVIKTYLKSMAKSYGQKRKTVIDELEITEYIEEIEEEDIYVLIDRFGYIKTIDVVNFQRSNEETISEFKEVILAKNTGKLTIFTREGNLHNIKLMDVPKGKVKDKGVPIETLVKIDNEEILLLDNFEKFKDKKIAFVTKKGLIKIVNGSEFDTNRSTIIATKLEEDDGILAIKVIETEEISHVVMLSEKGFALKFDMDDNLEVKKVSKGIKTIILADDDVVSNVFFIKKSDTESTFNMDGTVIDFITMKTKKRNQLGVKL